VEKSDVLEHKSGNISETSKDRGKVSMGAYRNSPTLFQTVPSPTPCGLFPKSGVHKTHLKLQSLLSPERVLRTSNLAGTFTGFIRTKSPLKIFEKRESGHIQGLPSF